MERFPHRKGSVKNGRDSIPWGEKTAGDCRTETSFGISRDSTEVLRKKTFGRYPEVIDLSPWNIMVPLYTVERSRCYPLLVYNFETDDCAWWIIVERKKLCATLNGIVLLSNSHSYLYSTNFIYTQVIHRS